jgi:hypothetical protein
LQEFAQKKRLYGIIILTSNFLLEIQDSCKVHKNFCFYSPLSRKIPRKLLTIPKIPKIISPPLEPRNPKKTKGYKKCIMQKETTFTSDGSETFWVPPILQNKFITYSFML